MNGIKNLKRVAIDTNIFIYHFEGNDCFTEYTDIVFNGLVSGKLRGVTSILTLGEILSYPNTKKVEDRLIEDFITTPNLKIVDIDLNIIVKAAQIRREYGFRLPDSIQLATAVLNKAEAFITNDKKLKQFDSVQIILLEQLKYSESIWDLIHNARSIKGKPVNAAEALAKDRQRV